MSVRISEGWPGGEWKVAGGSGGEPEETDIQLVGTLLSRHSYSELPHRQSSVRTSHRTYRTFYHTRKCTGLQSFTIREEAWPQV